MHWDRDVIWWAPGWLQAHLRPGSYEMLGWWEPSRPRRTSSLTRRGAGPVRGRRPGGDRPEAGWARLRSSDADMPDRQSAEAGPGDHRRNPSQPSAVRADSRNEPGAGPVPGERSGANDFDHEIELVIALRCIDGRLVRHRVLLTPLDLWPTPRVRDLRLLSMGERFDALLRSKRADRGSMPFERASDERAPETWCAGSTDGPSARPSDDSVDRPGGWGDDGIPGTVDGDEFWGRSDEALPTMTPPAGHGAAGRPEALPGGASGSCVVLRGVIDARHPYRLRFRDGRTIDGAHRRSDACCRLALREDRLIVQTTWLVTCSSNEHDEGRRPTILHTVALRDLLFRPRSDHALQARYGPARDTALEFIDGPAVPMLERLAVSPVSIVGSPSGPPPAPAA